MMLDPEFQQFVRRAVKHSAGGRGESGGSEQSSRPDAHRLFSQNLDRTVGAAMREGIAPDSPRAAEVVDRLLGGPGPERSAAVRARIGARLDAGVDGRLEHNRRLPAIMRGRQPPTPRTAAYTWLADAIDAGAGPRSAVRR